MAGFAGVAVPVIKYAAMAYSAYSGYKSAKESKEAAEAVAKASTTEPTVMPVADDAAYEASVKRSIIEQQKRGGRASTILTTEDKLGG